MVKSLDGLIRHLVDQIALCGEHGKSTQSSRLSVFELRIPSMNEYFISTLSVYCTLISAETTTIICNQSVLLQNPSILGVLVFDVGCWMLRRSVEIQ